MTKLILLDAYAIIYRSYYALLTMTAMYGSVPTMASTSMTAVPVRCAISSSTIRAASILLPGLMISSRTKRAGYGWVLIREVSS